MYSSFRPSQPLANFPSTHSSSSYHYSLGDPTNDTIMPPSPNDSAFSISTTTTSAQASLSKHPSADSPTKSKPSSPRLVPSAYTHLSAAEQAVIQAENAAAAEEAQNDIQIDDSGSDAGYETDSLASPSTSSMSSSVRDYAFENGRRYHKFREGSYNFPNDDSEQDREDMKHAMMVNLCGQRLHFAPIGNNPQNILDMGTGTGIWAIEMGDLYPGANILGVDLSPIQPDWVPPNVVFRVDDVESEWLKPKNYFEYVHARHTVMAIRNWPLLLSRVYDHLTPGGWLELQEIHHYPQCHDGSMPPDHPIAQYWGHIIQGLGALGVDFNATLLLEGLMRQAGFVNVTVRLFHVPIGTWPKNRILKLVGEYWRTILMNGLSPIALGPLTRGLGWTREQVEVWLIEVRNAYMEYWVHAHMPLYIICGQKPLPGVFYPELA